MTALACYLALSVGLAIGGFFGWELKHAATVDEVEQARAAVNGAKLVQQSVARQRANDARDLARERSELARARNTHTASLADCRTRLARHERDHCVRVLASSDGEAWDALARLGGWGA